MEQILVIDDDIELLKLIKIVLEKEHYAVETKSTVNDIQANELAHADLIILDVMMPEKDGFTFLRENRLFIDAPVLFLTAKDFEKDKLEGFASGGDDYITKPFSIKELRARVAAHLRRESRENHSRLRDTPVTCDLVQRLFFVDEQKVPLTASEYTLCEFLLKNRGHVFSKEHIYTSVYGYDAVGDSYTTITERIKQIRQKFQKTSVNPIQTVWGIGYKWEIDR